MEHHWTLIQVELKDVNIELALLLTLLHSVMMSYRRAIQIQIQLG